MSLNLRNNIKRPKSILVAVFWRTKKLLQKLEPLSIITNAPSKMGICLSLYDTLSHYKIKVFYHLLLAQKNYLMIMTSA
ncbi:MAG: hypothetical protein K0R25_1339 [Rickettsiaceae bacterium]|jgi:hypothetical protein|nr:hypothetical protein [Rickettsiaceae bacterium]